MSEASDDMVEVGPLSPSERTRVALFPLPNVVLFPGTAVALHLFEPRYRQLARDVIAGEGVARRVIVICALEPGWQEQYEGRPPLRPVACVGRVVDERANRDGTFDVALVGVERVRLHELPADAAPYRIARVEPVEESLPEGTAAARADLSAILRGLGVEVAPTAEGATSAFADRIADVAIPDAAVRQEILETLDVEARLRRIADAVTERALGARMRSSRPN